MFPGYINTQKYLIFVLHLLCVRSANGSFIHIMHNGGAKVDHSSLMMKLDIEVPIRDKKPSSNLYVFSIETRKLVV